MMPGESGVDLTKSLRIDKKVPILMLTALSETDSRNSHGLEAGPTIISRNPSIRVN